MKLQKQYVAIQCKTCGGDGKFHWPELKGESKTCTACYGYGAIILKWTQDGWRKTSDESEIQKGMEEEFGTEIDD